MPCYLTANNDGGHMRCFTLGDAGATPGIDPGWFPESVSGRPSGLVKNAILRIVVHQALDLDTLAEDTRDPDNRYGFLYGIPRIQESKEDRKIKNILVATDMAGCVPARNLGCRCRVLAFHGSRMLLLCPVESTFLQDSAGNIWTNIGGSLRKSEKSAADLAADKRAADSDPAKDESVNILEVGEATFLC